MGTTGKIANDAAAEETKQPNSGTMVGDAVEWATRAPGILKGSSHVVNILDACLPTGPTSTIARDYPFACAFLSRCETEGLSPEESMHLVKRTMDLDPLIKCHTGPVIQRGSSKQKIRPTTWAVLGLTVSPF
jgi:hypothetical protein